MTQHIIVLVILSSNYENAGGSNVMKVLDYVPSILKDGHENFKHPKIREKCEELGLYKRKNKACREQPIYHFGWLESVEVVDSQDELTVDELFVIVHAYSDSWGINHAFMDEESAEKYAEKMRNAKWDFRWAVKTRRYK